MPRKALRVIAVLAIAASSIAALVTVLGENREAIARTRSEAARLAEQRDSLVEVVRRREAEQAALAIQRETLDADAGRLRDSVIALERRRAAAQLTVRRLRTTGALLDRLRSTFPELRDSALRLTALPLTDTDTLGLEYLMVPAWFAETFVIDHANAESWRAQKDQLLAVDSLRGTVIALQDSITGLVAANAGAYQKGYQAAYTAHQDLSSRHIAELRKPRIRLGSALGILGAASVGLLVGRVLP